MIFAVFDVWLLVNTIDKLQFLSFIVHIIVILRRLDQCQKSKGNLLNLSWKSRWNLFGKICRHPDEAKKGWKPVFRFKISPAFIAFKCPYSLKILNGTKGVSSLSNLRPCTVIWIIWPTTVTQPVSVTIEAHNAALQVGMNNIDKGLTKRVWCVERSDEYCASCCATFLIALKLVITCL